MSGRPVACPALSLQLTASSKLPIRNVPLPTMARSFSHAVMKPLRASLGLSVRVDEVEHELAATDAAVGVDVLDRAVDAVDPALEETGRERVVDVGDRRDVDLLRGHADLATRSASRRPRRRRPATGRSWQRAPPAPRSARTVRVFGRTVPPEMSDVCLGVKMSDISTGVNAGADAAAPIASGRGRDRGGRREGRGRHRRVAGHRRVDRPGAPRRRAWRSRSSPAPRTSSPRSPTTSVTVPSRCAATSAIRRRCATRSPRVGERFGQVDALVNNAGIIGMSLLADADDDHVDLPGGRQPPRSDVVQPRRDPAAAGARAAATS